MFAAPVKAKLVRQTLVAHFRTSTPPMIWRLDMEKNHSFALVIQGQDGAWELGLVSPKGDVSAVARFAARPDVDAAYAAVGKAMMSNPSSLRNWAARVLITAGIAALALVGTLNLLALPAVLARKAVMTQTQNRPTASAPAMGMPMNADDFLKGR